jgi:excisionase family DNA binding protein
MTGDRLLTARAVAEQLGLSTETVLRWVRRGELPAIRFPGGAIRFRPEALEAWLEQRATPGREAPATRPSAARPGRYPLRSAVPATTEDEEH